MNETPVITVDRLTKRFGQVAAVTDLSFTVMSGTVTGFLGPNGAGKSTTLRSIVGLVRPTAGRATIFGHPYSDLPQPTRVVGAVLEAGDLHPRRTARNHLRVLAISSGVPLARVDEVLETVGLTDAADRPSGEFSLGMRQRLSLAGVLLPQPDVLILDEPANGLDPAGIRWLRTMLRQFADNGGTVLISSHVLAEMAQTVDHVVIIARGRFVTERSLEELTSASLAMVRARTPQPDILEAAAEAAGFRAQRSGPEQLLFSAATAQDVGSLAARSGVVITELTEQNPSLEEVFLDLTDSAAVEGSSHGH
jgi:ABC-2 type transport system ATP-binding protein